MNKEFSNIIIFNNKDLTYIKEKMSKIFIDLGYSLTDKTNSKFQIDILHDNINNICVISSGYFKFIDLNTNKSIIRKISKRVAQDTFMVTADNSISIIEKYSFNKRIYDYICFGSKDKLKSLGYVEAYGTYMYQEIWKNHFVGRNNISSLNKVLEEKNTFFEPYEIILEILKLYGIKTELATYKSKNEITSIDIQKEILNFE